MTSALYPIQIGKDSNWKSIATGTYYSFGTRTDGTLWGWGSNSWGQLGDGTITDRVIPTKIGIDTNWTKGFGSKSSSSFCFKKDSTLWACGGNGGQLGDGTTESRLSYVSIKCDLTSEIKSVLISLKSISLYPNPFTRTATLVFENPQNLSHQLSVFNTMGQLVMSIENIIGDKVLIDRKELQNGFYFYQLRNEEGVAGSGKIVIE